MTEQQVVVHADPIRRDRANFIIRADTPLDGNMVTEQLWARQIEPRRFELCCIPFFAYDLSLGDLVETDDAFVITRVVQPSGRYVFRAWFEDQTAQDEILEQLTRLGSLVERSSPHLVAIDAPDELHAKSVADFLQSQEALGVLAAETGKT